MSARERNAVRQPLESGLEAWHSRWSLEGGFLICRHCQSVHSAGRADQSFVHASGCALQANFLQYPWRELAELLRELPAVPQ